MAESFGGPISFSLSPVGPFFRMHMEAGIPAAPYSQRRTRLGLDSFVHLYAEKRSDPWERRRHTRKAPQNPRADGAAPLPLEHDARRGVDLAKCRALATYVLGVEPPAARTHAGPLRRQRQLRSSSGSLHRSCESVWGLQLVDSNPYTTLCAYGDENSSRDPLVLSPFASRGVRRGLLGTAWSSQQNSWCSNSPDCCCADCAEEVVTSRKSQRRLRGVSKNPYRILDAPNLPDDFYLNLVDWSVADCVAVGIRGSVLLWNAKTAATEVVFSKTSLRAYEEVASVSFSPLDPSLLCVGFRNGGVELWDIKERKKIRSLAGHRSRCAVSAWSKNQMLLWTGARDQTILTRDLRCHDPFISTFNFHQSELCGLDISPSENLLASGGNDNLLCVWDVRYVVNHRPGAPSGLFVTFTAKASEPPSQRKPSEDTLQRLSPDFQSSFCLENPVWHASLGLPSIERPPRSLGTSWGPLVVGPLTGSSPKLSFVRPLQYRSSFEGDNILALTRLPQSHTTSTRSSPERPTESSEASADESPIYFTSFSPTSSVPQLPSTESELHTQQHHRSAAERAGSAAGSASETAAGQQRGPGGVTTTPLFVYSEHKAAIKAVKFCPQTDGILASGGGTADRHIRFWNPKLGGSRSVFGVDTGCQVCNIAFSPHSSAFISTHGFSLNQIFLWEYCRYSLSSLPPEAAAERNTLSLVEALYPDGERDVVENIEPVRKTATLTGHSSRVLFLAASPCGSCVVTGAGRGDETLKFWRVFQPPDEGDEDAQHMSFI